MARRRSQASKGPTSAGWPSVLLLFAVMLIFALAGACSANTVSSPSTDEVAGAAETAKEIERPVGWDETSHSNQTAADYGVVFPQDRVSQLTITIDPDGWAAMQANIAGLLGAQGAERRPGDRQQPPTQGDAQGGRAPGGMGRNTDMTPENPMWVSATISFNGETWTHVGVRYKGNSTLTRAWREGSPKLPLKLDFDQFEDEYPEIDNQRFYGIKQLSLANGLHDPSSLRDALAYDVFEDAGLVAPETAFYEVILDHGQGPVNLGLYTAVEVVDDTVVERYFGGAEGNIYEGDGPGASLAAGLAAQIRTSFEKENNEETADWSDIERLHAVLHSAQRKNDPSAWRADLESVLDVDVFLEWLAVNAIIQDWDTYGAMSHNFYLYHNPATERLVWISWDHNESFSSGGRGDTSLDKAGVGENWPLIRFLLDDPVYWAKYAGYLRSALDEAFRPEVLSSRIDAMAALVRPYAESQGSTQTFDTAVAQLRSFVAQRSNQVEEFLSGQN